MSAPLSPEARAALAAVPEADGPLVDDAQLRAFRAGTLPPAEHDALAAAIAAHPENRALLQALGADADRPAGEDQAWMAGMRATRGPRLRRRAAWIGGAVALAAAIAVLTMRADLRPEYALDGPFGGIVEARGDTDTAEERAPRISEDFAPTSRLRLIARPLPDAPPAQTCVAFVQSPGQVARRVAQSAITLAPTGVCRLEISVDRLATTPGQHTVSLILGGAPDPEAGPPWPGWDADAARVLSTPFTLRTKAQP